MMIEPNILNETYDDLEEKGLAACANKSSFIVRKKHFQSCRELFTKTLVKLQKNIELMINEEANLIIPNSQINQINPFSCKTEIESRKCKVSMQRPNYQKDIERQLQVHPACALLGPRQVGKTTLTRSCLCDFSWE